MNSKMKVLTIFFLNNIKAVFVVSYKMYMNYERIWQYSIVFFLVNRGYWWLDMTVVLGSMLLIIAEVHLFTPTLTLFEHEIRIYSFPSFAIFSLLLFFLFFFLTQKSILLLFTRCAVIIKMRKIFFQIFIAFITFDAFKLLDYFCKFCI
jgi:hypothetical protein